MKTINKLILATVFLSTIFVVAFAVAPTALACGGSGWVNDGSTDYKACSGNAVYWFDECNNKLDLFQQCTSNQTCQNAACVNLNIACSTNSQCGTNGNVGGLFCQNNNVYKNYKTYTCNNPGTASSSCSNSTVAQLQTTCTGSQTCSNGSCVSTGCGGSGWVNDGSTDYKACSGNAVYWFDECNNKLDLFQQCTSSQTCQNAQCVNINIACHTDSDCGTNGITGGLFCQNNNVYQNYKTYTCNNPGTASSSCSNTTSAQLQTTCTSNQTCSSGSCVNTCTQNYQQRCVGTSMYWYDSCGNQGSYVGTCGNTCTANYQQRCNGNSMYWYDSCGNQGSYVGSCGNTCTANYQQRCNGTSMYWYDSCGNQGSYVGSCGNNYTNATLTVTKTVRDLTTNTTFATSTYANPSDMVMYMITVRASGNQDVQGVLVKDTLLSNLTYNGQLIVARSDNSYNNYSGDVMSGLNLNTISSGQTVTITYQAQVAPASSFTFGSTTLDNSVNVTCANGDPMADASVIVTKATVLGASTVSTGLTNNFWVDSFFLPLLITLIVIWMWRAGMFIGFEKWLDSKKKVRRGYKAEKEFSARIAKIHKAK